MKKSGRGLSAWRVYSPLEGLSASGGLIQKIYEVDPLKCPKCQGCMRVIAFIEDEDDHVIDPDTPVEAYF